MTELDKTNEIAKEVAKKTIEFIHEVLDSYDIDEQQKKVIYTAVLVSLSTESIKALGEQAGDTQNKALRETLGHFYGFLYE